MHTCTDCWVDLSTLHHSCKASLHKHLYTTIDDQYGSTFPVINHTFITHSNTELPIETQVAFSSPYNFCPNSIVFTFTGASVFCQTEFRVRTFTLEAASSVGTFVGAASVVQLTFIDVWKLKQNLVNKRHKSHHMFSIFCRLMRLSSIRNIYTSPSDGMSAVFMVSSRHCIIRWLVKTFCIFALEF